jgi:hypothetical protein
MRWLRIGVAVAALAAAGCGPLVQRSVYIDRGLAALAPSDTVTLGGVRLDALRTTPLWQKWVAGKPAAPLDELAKETGLDLRKDVAEVLMASNGKDGLVLAKGKFARAELEAALEKRGGRRMPHQGLTLIGSEEAAVVFFNANVAAAGRAPMLRRVIDQRGRGGAPKALLDEAKGIAAESQIWAVSIGGIGDMGKEMMPPGSLGNLAKLAGMVEKSSFAADLRAGLNASSTLLCRTEQDARTLSDAVRGIVGLARLSTPDNEPDLLRLLDGIQVSVEQRTLRIRAQAPQDLLDKALGKLSSLGPAALNPGLRLPRLP